MKPAVLVSFFSHFDVMHYLSPFRERPLGPGGTNGRGQEGFICFSRFRFVSTYFISTLL
jgi:hypothetical protein